MHTMEFYSAIKKNEILPSMENGGAGIVLLSEGSQTQKDRLCILLFFYFCLLLVLETGFSLCSPGGPETHSVDHTRLQLSDLPASASAPGVLGSEVCTTTHNCLLPLQCRFWFKKQECECKGRLFAK